MPVVIREIRSKTILSKSEIHDYVVNPYVGCQHACSYCYARFMKRFTGHAEPWGEFVDAKVNAPELLEGEFRKKKPGTVWVSGVCDPYQPLEAKHQLTRRCLDLLATAGWPVVIQTRSPLVLRDLDILARLKGAEVGFSITTADDSVRQAFEPHAPSIPERLRALGELHAAGLRTYAMIAPMLPGAEALVDAVAGKVDFLLVDRMNYSHAGRIYDRHGWAECNTDDYFRRTGQKITEDAARAGLECRLVF